MDTLAIGLGHKTGLTFGKRKQQTDGGYDRVTRPWALINMSDLQGGWGRLSPKVDLAWTH